MLRSPVSRVNIHRGNILNSPFRQLQSQITPAMLANTQNKHKMPDCPRKVPDRPENQIRRYRRSRCLRLRDVANLLELASPAHIAHWEKGRKSPSLENLLQLSAALQCPIEILFLHDFNRIRNKIHANRKKYGLWPN